MFRYRFSVSLYTFKSALKGRVSKCCLRNLTMLKGPSRILMCTQLLSVSALELFLS